MEHLKGQLRELAKENRQLNKLLNFYRKREHIKEVIIEAPEEIEIKRLSRCTECYKGFYTEFEICGKVYGTCTIKECGHRMRLK